MVWQTMTGWWTPGWGNLFTVAVAVAAILVSAYYNKRALDRTNLHFEQARDDARDDRLRAEIAAFLVATDELSITERTYRARLEELESAHRRSDTSPTTKELQRLVDETIGAAYSQVAVRAFSILMLTNDTRIAAPVHQIDSAASDALAHLRNVAGLGDTPRPHDVHILRTILRDLVESHAQRDRRTQIDGNAKLLKTHCLSIFRPSR